MSRVFGNSRLKEADPKDLPSGLPTVTLDDEYITQTNTRLQVEAIAKQTMLHSEIRAQEMVQEAHHKLKPLFKRRKSKHDN